MISTLEINVLLFEELVVGQLVEKLGGGSDGLRARAHNGPMGPVK
jgi:hypothetical protein